MRFSFVLQDILAQVLSEYKKNRYTFLARCWILGVAAPS